MIKGRGLRFLICVVAPGTVWLAGTLQWLGILPDRPVSDSAMVILAGAIIWLATE